MLDDDLPLPGYEKVLKAAQTFNLRMLAAQFRD